MAQIGLLRPAKHRPGHKPERDIFISLCCSASVVIQMFVMTKRCFRPTRGAGGGGLSTTRTVPSFPLPAHAGLSSVVWSPWLLPRKRHRVFRPKELPVLPGSSELGISQLSTSLRAAATRAAVYRVSHGLILPLSSISPATGVPKSQRSSCQETSPTSAQRSPSDPLAWGKFTADQQSGPTCSPVRRISPIL